MTTIETLRAQLLTQFRDFENKSRLHAFYHNQLWDPGNTGPGSLTQVRLAIQKRLSRDAREDWWDTAERLGNHLPHVRALRKAGACMEGVAFAAQYDTLQDAWDNCVDVGDLKWVHAVFTGEDMDTHYDCCEADLLRQDYACPRLPEADE